MDECSATKSTSLETLVIQNISNVKELKSKLSEIIKKGKDYEFDVSSCVKTLIKSNDQEIVLLTAEAISELVKCDEKRRTYSQKEIISPILDILQKEITTENTALIKQCFRALGNLCCDCDSSRKIILECGGVPIIINLMKNYFSAHSQLSMYAFKTLLNFAIGGQEFTNAMVDGGVVEMLQMVVIQELEKEEIDEDAVCALLSLLSLINENDTEILYSDEINAGVLKVLTNTADIDVSELCLDILHAQAEHDSVKTLIAKHGGIQVVCSRIEQLMQKFDHGELDADQSDVEAILKQACDLIVIVLTGDEAMHILYNKGLGEVYISMVKWLEHTNYHLITTGVLAIGNFARQDDYCAQMMDDKIYDKLLDLFDVYVSFGVQIQKEHNVLHPIEPVTITKIQHAILSALRNLTVPVANKRIIAAQGRAAPTLLGALLSVEDHHVAYKLLAAIRMLVDGQESVARLLGRHKSALRCVARWGHAGEYAGAAGEAPRLLAWAVKLLTRGPYWHNIVEVEGCISSLVNMLVASHSLMQNEAILALTLLAIETLKNISPSSEHPEFDYEKSFISQLIKSEIGKHVSILVDTNCAKMPVEVAENLLAFLDITSKKNKLALDYKEAKVTESLKKFAESRQDLSEDLKNCITGVIAAISDNGKD